MIGYLLATLLAGAPADYRQLTAAAVCVARRDRPAAIRLAQAEPGSPDERAAAAALAPALRACRSQDAVDARLGDAVADRLLVELRTMLDRNRPVPSDPAAFANLVYNGAGDQPRRAVALRCLVLSRGKAADALLRTEVGSRAEQRALDALVPALGACLPAGDRIGWTPLALRLGIARRTFIDGSYGPMMTELHL